MRGLMFSLGVALTLPAWGQAVGPEFQVNTYTLQEQYGWGRSVASDAAGNFVVVWHSEGPSGLDIRAQRFGVDGSLQGAEFQVNAYTTGDQTRAAVARNASGDFMVVWTDELRDGSNVGVFGRAFAADGTPQGGDFQVSQDTLGIQADPQVAATGDGTFITSWISEDFGGGAGVFARRFDSNGAPASPQFRVNTYTTGAQYMPDIAGDGSGGFVVAWSGRGGGDDSGVFVRRYNDINLPLSADFRVNTYTTASQDVPAIGVAGNGDFVVAWGSGTFVQAGPDGSLGGIRARRFDNVGVPQGPEFQVNTYTTSYQIRPAIGVAPDGRFAISWFSHNQDGDGDGVFGQLYDAGGAPVDAEFRVNTYTTSAQRNPSIAMLPNGRFVVAWNSYTQDGSYFGVFGQRFSLGGDVTPPVVVVSIPNGGESWAAGSTQTVVWTATDDTALDRFDVFLSRDGGATFGPTPICSATQPDQSCDWVVTGPATTQARVKVIAYDSSDNPGEDTSDANFTITTVANPFVTVTAPDTAGVVFRAGSTKPIRFIHNLGKNQPVLIELNRNYPNGAWEAIANPALTTGATGSVFNWTVTAPITTGATARVRVTAVNAPAAIDTGNASFTITSRVKVTQPNTAVHWKVATTKAIKWNHNYPTPHGFRIDIDRDGDLVCESPIAASVNASAANGTFNWVVNGSGSNNRICVTSLSDPLGTDRSDVAFTITP